MVTTIKGNATSSFGGPVDLGSSALTTTGTITGDVAKLSTATGSAPSYSARAWINFNGTGTVAIRGSANVSSLTDNGTGDYRINLTTAMADTNYSVVTSANEFATYFNGGLRSNMCYIVSTSVCGLACNYVNGSSADPEIACLAVFR